MQDFILKIVLLHAIHPVHIMHRIERDTSTTCLTSCSGVFCDEVPVFYAGESLVSSFSVLVCVNMHRHRVASENLLYPVHTNNTIIVQKVFLDHNEVCVIHDVEVVFHFFQNLDEELLCLVDTSIYEFLYVLELLRVRLLQIC